MKISEKDYNLLVAMVEFHFKFSEYVRESDPDFFYRALDYAKTYTKSNGVEFDYWHEDNPRFLEELLASLHKIENSYRRLCDKVGDEERAKQIWMKKKNTNSEDLLGMNNYIKNFIRHAKELNYDDFSLEDWVNYVKICKYVKDDDKFLDFAYAMLTKSLGVDHALAKELKNNENTSS